MARRPGDQTDPDPEVVSDDLTGTVLRGAGLSGIGHMLAQVFTLGFYLALARLLTPDDFGEFAAAAIILNAGLLFIESGMLAALISRRDRIEEAASTAVFSTALGGVAFSLLALAASPLVGLFFDSDRVAALAAAVSGLLLLRSLQVVPEALLQRRFSFLRRMVIEPLQVIAFGVAAVIAASDGLGPWALVIGYYAAAVTDVLLSWVLVRWRPQPGLASFAMWKELIGYARHVLASNVVLRLGEQVPTLLIGRYVGTAPLGQYRYADRIAGTPFLFILSAASSVILPAFSRISHERERFAAAFLTVLAMVFGADDAAGPDPGADGDLARGGRLRRGLARRRRGVDGARSVRGRGRPDQPGLRGAQGRGQAGDPDQDPRRDRDRGRGGHDRNAGLGAGRSRRGVLARALSLGPFMRWPESEASLTYPLGACSPSSGPRRWRA